MFFLLLFVALVIALWNAGAGVRKTQTVLYVNNTYCNEFKSVRWSSQTIVPECTHFYYFFLSDSSPFIVPGTHHIQVARKVCSLEAFIISHPQKSVV